MSLHLSEISQAVAPGAHAVVLLDQAGWHQSKRLLIPANITLVPLPAKAPELNPVENVWALLRSNKLVNRVYDTYDAILDDCADAWDWLTSQPHRITAIASSPCAQVSQ
jgi:transposase